MKNKNIKYLLIVWLTVILTSCVSSEKMVYFQGNQDNLSHEDYEIYEPKIQKGDILSINVSAIDKGAAVPFNLYESTSTTEPIPLTYIVDNDGEITFPVVGILKVEGITTKILKQQLTKTLAEYLAKPIVNIRLVNFKVAVLGEVKTPGTYLIPNERISVIEAISLAGDLTIHGKRKTVMLIREQGGKRAFITLDLTDKKIFNSPYFYMAQNDVIYVEPNKTKLNSSAVGANAGIILSSISSLISIILILNR
ncbi:polysaccharide export outer membrane protein [Flavobacterium sp. CG_9.1]|uniref:polysaccharide biosynthesis/export family protein n=1 Tax=Flavobacterium sp. CG_9.1 TaxID=2787728 RepID=UPI0018CB1B92|nr:polysaccharide biosynthesis/export family protein [Flavobacterium sp. CG_9.1]MBG6062027.1 polysaccharide export outer membrane protein [Flavobacterium sp. CG_9.1]